MRTLVIHPSDPTTDFLKQIYAGHDDWTIVTDNRSKSFIKSLIIDHDRIIMLGHGSEEGLFGHNKMFIGSELVYLLREKYCVCIWCNADVFVKKYELKGFYTGMIISEAYEAEMYYINATQAQLKESNFMFAYAVSKNIDTLYMADSVKHSYDHPTNQVIQFNRHKIFFNHTGWISEMIQIHGRAKRNGQETPVHYTNFPLIDPLVNQRVKDSSINGKTLKEELDEIEKPYNVNDFNESDWTPDIDSDALGYRNLRTGQFIRLAEFNRYILKKKQYREEYKLLADFRAECLPFGQCPEYVLQEFLNKRFTNIIL